ncbi:hypothetical protein BH09PLA1_BH09PLA1_23230 [soil metagenome]
MCVCAGPRSESSPDDPQKHVEIISERATTNSIALVAVSKVDYPLTVNVELTTLENLKSTAPGPFTVVVQPKKRTQVTKLSKINPRKATRYATNYTSYAGWRDEKAKPFVYTLPWEPGFAYRIGQGFNGQFSHQGKNAIDFVMPERATICAARDGVVIEARQNFSEGGVSEEFKDKANRVLILHSDGTLGRYAHFVHNGVKVKVGQKVSAGEPIGLCGATGYAQGPHLHFEVDRPPKPGENQYDTVPIQFLACDANGKESPAEPKEGATLQRPDGSGAAKLPPNLIEEIVLCGRVDVDGKPVDISDVFSGDASMTILLRIGAPGERTLKLSVSSAGDQNAPALYEREIATKSNMSYFWTSMNLADAPKLRGALVLRLTLNDQPLAERPFRVQ